MATHSVFLSGESHGQRNLAGYSLWGCKELDVTEETEQASMHQELMSGHWLGIASLDNLPLSPHFKLKNTHYMAFTLSPVQDFENLSSALIPSFSFTMSHTCQACANNFICPHLPRISEIMWKFLTEKELFQEWKLLTSSYYWPVIKTWRICADGLVRWFSVLSVHQNYTESLLKCNCWAPPLEFLILSSLEWDPNFAFFSKFPEGCCCCWSGDSALRLTQHCEVVKLKMVGILLFYIC